MSQEAKQAAKNIRKELKAAFPKTKFSVRVPHFDTIYVTWGNEPSAFEVSKITQKYERGSFNGMEDIYEKHADFDGANGSAKFIIPMHDPQA